MARTKGLRKGVKVTEVFAEVGREWQLIDSFTKAINKLGGHVTVVPSTVDSNAYAYLVSNKKLLKSEVKMLDDALCGWKE